MPPTWTQGEELAQRAHSMWSQRPGDDPSTFVDPYELDQFGRPLRQRLTGTTALATLPQHREWQEQNPEQTLLRKYRHSNTHGMGGYQWGEGITRTLADPDNRWRRMTGRGALPGAASAGTAGAIGGGIIGLILGALRGDARSGAGWGAGLGGAAGLALGGYAGAQRAKSASTTEQQIIQALQQAPGLSFNERAHLVRGVQSLPEQDLRTLVRMLQTTGGAGIGALIARFLLDKRRGGLILGALTGGVIGRALGQSTTRNEFGQTVQPGRNVYGRPF